MSSVGTCSRVARPRVIGAIRMRFAAWIAPNAIGVNGVDILFLRRECPNPAASFVEPPAAAADAGLRRAYQKSRRRRRLHATGMFDECLSRRVVRMPGRFAHGKHRCKADIGAFELSAPLRTRATQDGRCNLFFERRPARRIVLFEKPRIVQCRACVTTARRTAARAGRARSIDRPRIGRCRSNVHHRRDCSTLARRAIRRRRARRRTHGHQ